MFIISSLRWFTLLCFLFWFVVYWQGGRKAIGDIKNAAISANSRLDTVLMLAIALFSLVVVGSGLLISLGGLQAGLITNWLGVLAGDLLVILGIIGMFYCRQYLGRFWTAETTLLPNHQVVDKGPYGVVRHPIYSFASLMYVGLGLVFSTWWCLLSASIIVLAYAIKAWDEDRFLERRLSGYAEYRQRVGYRLIPGVW